MYCIKCGAQLPDDAKFCYKCGAAQAASGQGGQQQAQTADKPSRTVLAAPSVTELKCPGCGAPIRPQFGEMVITCEYCGTSVALAEKGWENIQKHTMLPLKIEKQDQVLEKIKDVMDKGLLRRHFSEDAKLEEINLSVVPYWIVPVSARTTYTAVDVYAQVGTIATTAALFGAMGGAFGGGGRGRGMNVGTGLLEGTLIGSMVGGGLGGGNSTRAYSLNMNYQFPVVAMKALDEYQPKNYEFDLDDRSLFDAGKFPKDIKVMNGDVGEEAAVYEAKTNVNQLQYTKVHAQHHMVQSLHTEMDTSDPELMHVPVWFARFERKGKKIVVVVDGHNGGIINSIGLD